MRALLLGMGLALAGCATAPDQGSGAVRTISYQTGPCFGFCPTYRLTVSSDGQGRFESLAQDTSASAQNFTVTPRQFGEFEARLAPHRPSGERRVAPPDCNGREATDLPSVDVRWSGGAGPDSRLYAYYGCDMETNAALFEALRRAPEVLPVAELVRASTRRP